MSRSRFFVLKIEAIHDLRHSLRFCAIREALELRTSPNVFQAFPRVQVDGGRFATRGVRRTVPCLRRVQESLCSPTCWWEIPRCSPQNADEATDSVPPPASVAANHLVTSHRWPHGEARRVDSHVIEERSWCHHHHRRRNLESIDERCCARCSKSEIIYVLFPW